MARWPPVVRRVVAISVAAFVLRASPALAEDWLGVGIWRGEIGGQPVTACFNDASAGAWYDRTQMRLVTLLADRADPGVWKEDVGGKGGGQWSAVSVSGDTLSARRSDKAVSLKRIASSGCSDPAFDSPREKLSAPKAEPPRVLEGRHWRPVVVKGLHIPDFEIDTAELLDPSPAIAAINAELSGAVPKTDAQVADFFSCNQDQLGLYPQDGSLSITLEPKLWTDELVGVRKFRSWSCGGAHPDFEHGYFLWSARTGKAIEIATWFRDRMVKPAAPGEAHEVDKPLADTILAASGRADCADALRDTRSFDLEPAPHGMIFVPSGVARAMRACEDEIVVPYERLKPFLTSEGNARIEAIR
jgi:hypothetical protein